MTKIWHKSTLFEYDGPQIFEARDRIGGHYIAVAVEDSGADQQYLVVGTEVEKLRKFRIGEMDLRTLLVESSGDGWYLTESNVDEEQSYTIRLQQSSILEHEHLPDSDFFLYDNQTTDTLISEARTRDKLVVEIVTETPDTGTQHRIRASVLSGLLDQFQSLVSGAYGNELGTNNTSTSRKRIKELTQLDVVIPAAQGSFRMLLEASKPRDLFGVNPELASALKNVDDLFASVTAVHQQQYHVPVRGKSLNQFNKLLKFLDSNNTNLKYAWAEPQFDRPISHTITTNQIQSYVATMDNPSTPEFKEVNLVGEIERVNRQNKTWGLYADDGSILRGIVEEDGNRLNGLTVGKRYEFRCLQKISDQNDTSDTSSEYIMKSYKRL